jgi:hypothetical protein
VLSREGLEGQPEEQAPHPAWSAKSHQGCKQKHGLVQQWHMRRVQQTSVQDAQTRPALCPQSEAAQKVTLTGNMAKSGPHLGTPAGSAGAW